MNPAGRDAETISLFFREAAIPFAGTKNRGAFDRADLDIFLIPE
jgi:hypothetical protein